ncbi:unnamed protein product, partial [Heterotrigona itama]
LNKHVSNELFDELLKLRVSSNANESKLIVAFDKEIFQIPSYDPNSHCLCVGGEVYCWWQNYNPSTDPSTDPSFLPSTTIESNYTPSLEGSTDAVDSLEASGDPAEEPSVEQQGYTEINTTYATTSQPAPTTCLVM